MGKGNKTTKLIDKKLGNGKGRDKTFNIKIKTRNVNVKIVSWLGYWKNVLLNYCKLLKLWLKEKGGLICDYNEVHKINIQRKFKIGFY